MLKKKQKKFLTLALGEGGEGRGNKSRGLLKPKIKTNPPPPDFFGKYLPAQIHLCACCVANHGRWVYRGEGSEGGRIKEGVWGKGRDKGGTKALEV